MNPRLITLVLLSFFLIMLSFKYFERKINVNFISSDSQLTPMPLDVITHKPKGIHLSVSSYLKTHIQKNDSRDLTKDGIFWSDYAESLVPRGRSFNESIKLMRTFRVQQVKSISRGNKRACGSRDNGILQLADNTRMCARTGKYIPYVYSEALTFYLSRLLHTDNVPEIILVSANSSYKRWNGLDMSALKWKDDQTVALMKYIENSNLKTFMPQLLKDALKTRQPVTSKMVQYTEPHIIKPDAVSELIQWGTIIIFDYLIGHYDRFLKYQSIGPPSLGKHSFHESLHNCIKTSNGKLWLIDNEKTFFYRSERKPQIHGYSQFMNSSDRTLKAMCVFQSSLVDELRSLSRQKSAYHFVLDYARSFEPLLDNVKGDPRFEIFSTFFNTRLYQIIEWIEYCKSLRYAKLVRKNG